MRWSGWILITIFIINKKENYLNSCKEKVSHPFKLDIRCAARRINPCQWLAFFFSNLIISFSLACLWKAGFFWPVIFRNPFWWLCSCMVLSVNKTPFVAYCIFIELFLLWVMLMTHLNSQSVDTFQSFLDGLLKDELWEEIRSKDGSYGSNPWLIRPKVFVCGNLYNVVKMLCRKANILAAFTTAP